MTDKAREYAVEKRSSYQICAGCGEEYATFLGESLWEGKRYCCDSCAGRSPNQIIARLEDELAAERLKSAKLRNLLLTSGRNAGAFLTDGASDEFLEGVPEEIRLKIASARSKALREAAALCLRHYDGIRFSNAILALDSSGEKE